ncbi:sensor histidine kinase [Corynebacterium sp. H130]|uniref:sensor histidine kinase n=1 Tax=Corynebacterium sp. H130 TaxID=3133444 RepID=UPI0030B35BD0
MSAKPTNPHLIHSAWRWLHGLMFGLVGVLIVLAVVRSPASWPAALAFTLALVGWEYCRIKAIPAPTFLLLLAAFSWFLWSTEDAAFLAFPLFFALTHAHGGWRAVGEVGALTAVTVCLLGRFTGFALGASIGPVIGALVALAVGLGFRLLISESEARAMAIEELIDAKARATAMAREAGETNERARLAGEIHDTVAQGLSSIQLLLHSAERRANDLGDEQLYETLQLARTTAAENLQETRRIITALQPAPLADTTLPVALARVCSTTPLGNAITFDIDGDTTDLTPEQEAVLLRVTQTLVANVVSHSQATKAHVTLTYQPDAVIVDVVDNGVGFDPETIRPGSFGLGVARRRLAALGGELTIESSPGTGTGVRARVPMGEK